jgi:ABC-type amino acid transport substrate-binding protein
VDHDQSAPRAEPTQATRRRMLLAGAGVLAASAAAGCGLTSSDDSSAKDTGGGGGSQSSALDRIKKDKKIRFGVDLSFQPLQFRDPKTKEPTGYSIEVSKLLAAALGAKPEWVEVPFQEIIAAQKAGRFDMTGIPVVNTAERALEVAFAAAPAFLEGTYLFKRGGLGVQSIADLNDSGITIALLAGSAQVNTAKLLFPKAKRKELPDDVSATSDVTTGRSDALFIGDYAVGDARRRGLELIQAKPVATAWNTYFLPQGDVPLNQFVTTFLQQKASDLTLANLWQQWVASEIERYGVQSAPVKDPYLAAAYA